MDIYPRGQYSDDQVTPIAVGAFTNSGVSNNIWMESDVYVSAPSTDLTSLNIENKLTGTAFTGAASATTAARYLKIADLITSRRGGNMAYDTKNKRFVFFGGYNGTVRFNEVWELSADSTYARWKKLTPSGTPPSARNLAASTFVRGTTSGSVDKAYMVIWGGATPSDNNQMFTLDLTTPGSEAWTTITQTSTPAVRSYLIHHMVSKSTATNTNDIYLFGGWGTTRTNDLVRCTFDVNSPGAVTWTTLKADGAVGSPSGRSGTGMIYDSANDRLIIMGGYTGSSYLADVWQYSISGGTFTQLTPTGTTPGTRELHNIGYDVANQRAIITGGWQGSTASNRNDVIQLSLTSGSESWTTIRANDTSNQAILAMSSCAAAVDTSRNIMVIAAMNGYDATTKYVYAFDMDNTSTTAPLYSLMVSDYMRARDAPASVFDTSRNELLFINGYSAMDDDTTVANGEHVSEVWAYDRTNNKWRSAAKGPFVMAQNEGGLAIYDSANSRVIYFGGLTGSAQKSNDVWELKADTYGMYKATRLSPTGTKPTQRWLMTGCYDAANQRMVLWGGQSTSGVLGDVWALSLTSGSEAWTQLTPTGSAPTAAWQSAFAYDSSSKRLYVHGGSTNFGDTTYTSQLFYLDVSTTNGSWVDAGATGGLAVRGASMGFDSTNGRLICFGGYDGAAVNNTVRYINTSSFGAWITQATGSTPSARRSSGVGMIGNNLIIGSGRPVSGVWMSDTQELDTSVTPASWTWVSKAPNIYQTLAAPLSSLTAGGHYHWQAWAVSGATTGTAVSFGSNSESAPDYIISGAATGQIKAYVGGVMTPKPVKVWNGSSWVTKPVKVWNGSSWVTTTY
jgi:hypothetical protein